MKLKALELCGFKSFAEPTRIQFDRGVTAIVGPNGCGKSNVVDAVKWVLGEQSARSLRGREMMDVIFSGTERRAAAGFSEVTLVFDNDDGVLGEGRPEVSVTRRLTRAGDSLYFVNRETAKLRDVRDLFLGTGLGPGGYSFMEQGKIDSVLASNPVDRRRVFEEAAGISRFRSRRHETELKLDKVEANLLRLSDIVEELARQQRSLKIQAGKAERFLEFQTRAKELRKVLALHSYAEAAAKETVLATELDEIQTKRATLTTRREELRVAVEAQGKELDEKLASLAALREKCAATAAKERAAHEMADFQERHLAELESRSRDRTGEIADLEKEIERSTAERAGLVEETKRVEQEILRLRDLQKEREAVLAEVRQKNSEREAELTHCDRALQALTARQVDLNRELARTDAEMKRWTDESDRGLARLVQAEEQKAALAVRRDDVQKRRDDAHRELAARNEALAKAEQELDELEKAVSAKVQSHRDLLSEISRNQSRVDVLEGHVSRQEGLDAGVKAVLDERKRRPGFLAGFEGLLVDLLRADLGVAEAVEAALGEFCQAILVKTVAEALEGVRFLAERGRGRAAFIALDAFQDVAGELPAGLTATQDGARRVLAALLEGVSVKDAASVEASLARGEVLPPLVVTPDGAVVRMGRIFSSGKKNQNPGLVAVRSELDLLRQKVKDLREQAMQSETALRELEARRNAGRERVKAASNERVSGQGQVARVEQEVRAVENEAERWERDYRSLKGQIEAAQNRAKEMAAAQKSAEAALAETNGRLDAERIRRKEVVEAAQAGRTESDTAFRSLETVRIELAGMQQHFSGLVGSERLLRERHEKAVKSIDRFKQDLDEFAGDVERSTSILSDERAKTARFAEELDELRRSIESSEAATAEVRAQYDVVASDTRAVEQELEATGSVLHRTELSLNEIRVNQENLVKEIRRDLGLELAELHREFDVAEADWPALEAEFSDCEDKMRKLGNVNLAAVDDLKEVDERLEFLVAQRNDLVQSKQQLGKVLNDIEHESTRLFVETFERVRSHFLEIFQKLFGGGKADIKLMDETNVLESGIEIYASPAGKKMQAISLMSGGERTLTAVALLFSIIRANPAPCVLLDEVDAALDEDNTERFTKLLDEFLTKTQFILITHSRRTMARADALFGITMAERGVSRQVGVRFENVRDDGSFTAVEELPKDKKPAATKEKRAIAPAAGPAIETSVGTENSIHALEPAVGEPLPPAVADLETAFHDAANGNGNGNGHGHGNGHKNGNGNGHKNGNGNGHSNGHGHNDAEDAPTPAELALKEGSEVITEIAAAAADSADGGTARPVGGEERRRGRAKAKKESAES